jgi:hypothetical protein
VAEVHVVRKQRLARDGVRSGDHPVVRSIYGLARSFEGLLRPEFDCARIDSSVLGYRVVEAAIVVIIFVVRVVMIVLVA